MATCTLLAKAVELVDISSENESDELQDRHVGLGSSKCSSFKTDNSSSVWKDLMGVMQKNQKSGNGNQNKTGKSGGSGRGLKRAASQPNQSTNTGNFSGNDDVMLTIFPKRAKRDMELKLELDIDNSDEALENYVKNQNNSAVAVTASRLHAPPLGPRSNSVSAMILNKNQDALCQPVKSGPVFPIFGVKVKPEEQLVTAAGDKSQVKPEGNNSCWNQEKITISLNETPDQSNSEKSTPNNGNGNGNKRQCPFYKKIPGTNFSVDAFSYGLIPGIDVYFLSHFHSDHYVGLTKKFNAKTIICSSATGNLVKMKLGVSENCIRKLELNTIYSIQGTDVVLIDANHCPGSVMFILRLPNGKVILHTGDFRFTPDMLANPFVLSLRRVDCMYLDTTYCDPKFDFPSQTDAIDLVVENVKRHIEFRPKTLIVCGAYCIGKERVFFTLAKALNLLVFCEADKRRVIRALETPEFLPLLGDTDNLCQIHVLPMHHLNPKFLSEYLAERSALYNNVIAIKPTGWEFSRTGKGMNSKQFFKDTVTVIGVPYSEHSSFSELREFVSILKPIKVQPTVNVGSEPKRDAMNGFFSKWLGIKHF